MFVDMRFHGILSPTSIKFAYPQLCAYMEAKGGIKLQRNKIFGWIQTLPMSKMVNPSRYRDISRDLVSKRVLKLWPYLFYYYYFFYEPKRLGPHGTSHMQREEGIAPTCGGDNHLHLKERSPMEFEHW